MLLEEMMTKLQMARRAILAVAAVLVAAPLHGARAQAREVGSPGSGGGASSFIWVRNETEFAQALQDGAAQDSSRCSTRAPPSL
jgi:hypothetical protein